MSDEFTDLLPNTEIVVQCDLGGLQIAFTGVAATSEEELNQRLDVCLKAIGRQRAKQQLTEKLVDLQAAQHIVANFETLVREKRVARALERARELERINNQYKAAWSPTKNGEYQPTGHQRKTMHDFGANFDIITEQEVDKLKAERVLAETSIPTLEAQLARLRDVIAGRDPAEPLEAKVQEAAD